jgi:type IX secretion system PorP/SprF family membrane protein
MKKIIILSLLSTFSIVSLMAQDPEFTQYYAAPLYTNPAMAGNAFCSNAAAGRFSINYRNQWPSLPGTYRTMAASVDQHVDQINGGLGFLALFDRAGAGRLTTTSLSGMYAYVFPVNERRTFFIRAGFEATFIQRSIDFNSLLWSDQIDPIRGFIFNTNEQFKTERVSSPNFASGIIGYSQRFYVGFAVHNIIEPKMSFYDSDEANTRIPRRYTFHSGTVIPLDKRRVAQSTFSPNILFMNQQNFTQLNLGFYLNRGPLVTGLWFRQTFGEFKTADALMVMFGFRKDRLKVAYSYDITVSTARTAAPGSHEISATIEWCLPPSTRGFKPMKCPEF